MDLPILRPMEPVAREAPFDDPAWVYQVKWDGIRLVAYIENGRTVLRTRRGRDCSAVYPELADGLPVRARSAVLDGELIALDERGRPSFQRILRRHLAGPAARPPAPALQYIVFDLVYRDGAWLTGLPLAERQAELQKAVSPSGLVQLCDNHCSGRELYAATARLGLEGIVAKERLGTYHRGRKHRTWQKIRHLKEIRVVVIGVVMNRGRANALLVARQADGVLMYAGRVGTGLDAAERHLLTTLAWEACAPPPVLANRDRIPRGLDIRWLAVRPAAWVRFLEWTEQGLMREPVLVGFDTGTEQRV